jgi:hypothetical protein
MFLLYSATLSAQNGVAVSNLVVTAGTVTFNVAWDRDAMPVALWSDTVWVVGNAKTAGSNSFRVRRSVSLRRIKNGKT